jgi:hypothetical protein
MIDSAAPSMLWRIAGFFAPLRMTGGFAWQTTGGAGGF